MVNLLPLSAVRAAPFSTLTPSLILFIAIGVGAIVGVAEILHARRVRRVARLAFGPVARPARWTAIAGPLRTVSAAAVAWGALTLLTLDPEVASDLEPGPASKHVLIALDVSPSMLIEDAGPEREKVKRAVWGGEVVQGVLDRLDMSTTRVSLVAFYTEALPVFIETPDKEVVRNALDGLQMYPAFEAGETKLQQGVEGALEVARRWMPDTATLIVLSDGDALPASLPRTLPPSIADAIVVGVGDPHRSTMVSGHSSRQDTSALKQLAARLGGIYHDGNQRHLPSELVSGLTMIRPRLSDQISWRDAALAALGAGAAGLAFLPVALSLFGRPMRGRATARSSATAARPMSSAASASTSAASLQGAAP
ncbi:MAG: VWA domain-containing protein [Phycisphaerales bacterium]